MSDHDTPDSRREFLAMAAMAAAGVGAMLPMASTAVAAPTPGTELAADISRWFDAVPGKYRQVTDWPDVNNGFGLAYTLGFLLSAPVGYGVPASEVGAILVMRHDSAAVALRDEIWAKYNLGAAFKINDPKTGAPAVRNPYYLEPGALPFPDMALSKLIERGVGAVVCDLALTFRSGMIAKKMGLDPAEVKKEWIAGLHPGVRLMPSGVFACHAATAKGCSYLYAG